MQNFEVLDVVVFCIYFVTVIGIAYWVSRKPDSERTSEDFFLAGRALPWWIIGASLIASNISAEQMIGMTGSAYVSGIAIVSYEWMAAVTLLIVAKWFLPTFLNMRIYSMPQYLENRFDYRVSMGLGVFWLLVYVFVNLATVTYLGALTLQTVMGLPLMYGIIALLVISAMYTLYGGLSAVAWTDFIQVAVLFLGGTVVTIFGLHALGQGGLASGFMELWKTNPDKFHTVLPWYHKDLPWIGVFFGGLWMANLSYWGCNQYITQRALAAKNINEAQLGLVFAAFLKIIVPIVVMLPGIIAFALYQHLIPEGKPDQAYPTLIRELVPAGFTGLIIAALIAAIVSSLNSMTNSTATIFTMDIYRKINHNASERNLVFVGRVTSALVLFITIFTAPLLASQEQVFQYIQEYTGMVSPGVVAIFFFGLFWKRTTSAAALTMVILTIPVSIVLKVLPTWIFSHLETAYAVAPFVNGDPNFGAYSGFANLLFYVGLFFRPFLNQMFVAFIILAVIGYFVSLVTKQHVVREDEKVSYRTSAIFNVTAIFALGVLAVLYITFF
ncbi:MAG: sodium/solute symporter [bacterium]|nr:sodium/solute symporter [bacterium]